MTRRVLTVCLVFVMAAASCTSSPDADPTSTTTTAPRITTTAGAAAFPPEPAPIIPVLRSTGGATGRYGETVSLTSQVLAAEPIQRLELWVDAELVASKDFEAPTPDPSVPWEWTPDSIGLHALTVRAFDQDGHTMGSFPLWHRVLPAWDVETGAELEGLPISPLETASPGVDVDEQACVATITVAASDGSLGQAVTGTTFGAGGFRALGVVGPEGGAVTVPAAVSPVVIAVEPYDDATYQPGSRLVVPGVASCATGEWSGAVAMDGAIVTGAAAYDRLYLYATDDASTWHRIPDTGFVTPGPAGFDFTGLLPPLGAGAEVDIEVWGWDGDRLDGLGRARYGPTDSGGSMPDPGWGAASPVQPHSSLLIVKQGFDVGAGVSTESLRLADCIGAATAGCSAPPQTLRWDTNLLGAEAGMVQVATSAPPAGSVLGFPGLVWSTMIATDGESVRDFTLDLGAIINGTAPDASSRSFDGTWFEYPDLLAMNVELSVVDAPAAPGAQPRMSVPASNPWEGLPPSRVWVRVVPLTNGVPIAGASNTVTYDIDESDIVVVVPPDFDTYYDVEVDFTHPQRGNDTYFHCLRVVSNPFGKENPVPDDPTFLLPAKAYWQTQFNEFRDAATVHTPTGTEKAGLVPGATVCSKPKPEKSKGILDYVVAGIEFVGQAWDTFKDLVDMVKSGIIEGIVDIVGCEPKETCVTALTALADVGLASIGVPPNLPSFQEVVDAAKGDMAELLAAQLVGENCGPIPCEQFAREFIEGALDDIEEHFSDLAVSQARSGDRILWLHPDIRVVPEPAGHIFTGSVTAKITRRSVEPPAGVTVPSSCTLSLGTSGTGPLSWTDKEGVHHEQEVITGPVFVPRSISADLSDLGPGDSISMAVASIDFVQSGYLPGTAPHLGGFEYQEELTSHELWRDPDTVLTMTADVCGSPYDEVLTISTTGATPADIPTP